LIFFSEITFLFKVKSQILGQKTKWKTACVTMTPNSMQYVRHTRTNEGLVRRANTQNTSQEQTGKKSRKIRKTTLNETTNLPFYIKVAVQTTYQQCAISSTLSAI